MTSLSLKSPDEVSELVPTLEELHISYVQTLPMQICSLENLMTLEIAECKELTSLPREIGKLQSLQRLYIENCHRLSCLPEELGNLTRLETLILDGCCLLRMIPPTVGRLRALRKLGIYECHSLSSLPESLGDLTQLECLTIKDCQLMQTIPESFERLQQGSLKFKSLDTDQALRMIHFEASPGLGSISRNPPTGSTRLPVESLSLKCCELERLPQIFGWLEKLEKLKTPCCKLHRASRQGGLKILELEGCSHYRILPPAVGDWKDLMYLQIVSSTNLVTLPDEIGRLTQLEELLVYDCLEFSCLPPAIGKLVNLTKLVISGCDEILDLPEELGGMASLEGLAIRYCKRFRDLPTTLVSLEALQKLDIENCPKFLNFPQGMEQLKNLTQITCNSITKNPGNLLEMALPRRLWSFVGFEEDEWKAIPKGRFVEFLKKHCYLWECSYKRERHFWTGWNGPDGKGDGVVDQQLTLNKCRSILFGGHLQVEPMVFPLLLSLVNAGLAKRPNTNASVVFEWIQRWYVEEAQGGTQVQKEEA